LVRSQVEEETPSRSGHTLAESVSQFGCKNVTAQFRNEFG
jgi:hypothetical protein